MNVTTLLHTDLLTPLGAYLHLRREGRAAFLLESVEQGRLGRHSLVGCGDRLVTFAEAEALDEPVVGYLAYDHIATLEPTVPLPAAGRGLPESRFVVADVLVRFDHARGVAEVLAGDGDGLHELLQRPLCHRSRPPPAPAGPPCAGAAGRRTSAASRPAGSTSAGAMPSRSCCRSGPSGGPTSRRWRSTASSGASTRLPTSSCSSWTGSRSSAPRPRRSSSRREALASVNPIAGSTSPGAGDAERLLASEKDRAEHVMLVDLGRNDLSRVCVPGTVRVARFLEAERFSHITHLVSEVVGDLRPEVSPFDLLRATFPAGTVSGAPKVRAMQIISELEGYRRGPYAGAVLYALPGGPLDACIAIRTIVLHEGAALFQAGAGIVRDSDPRAEHEECLRKLAALETALDLAEAQA